MCSESRTHQQNTPLIPLTTCEAAAYCKDLAHFKEQSRVVAESPGVFDYFVYAENKAGERSTPSCQTVIVSDKAPTVTGPQGRRLHIEKTLFRVTSQN